jgi:hypothetical protein
MPYKSTNIKYFIIFKTSSCILSAEQSTPSENDKNPALKRHDIKPPDESNYLP